MQIDRTNVAIVIPAYKPGPLFVELVTRLSSANTAGIVVVDDGSGPSYSIHFTRVQSLHNVTVLTHAVNLGKGAALKTALNHVACEGRAIGVVTADADGQHTCEDILRIADSLAVCPEALILGSRTFHSNVPFRSRLGNLLTRTVVRLLVGCRLADTQTGLRGIPISLALACLKIPSSGYEFELDMLIAAHHQNCPISEIPISTIYLDGNQTSHFNPLRDSMRIYFVLLRFSAVSLVTALIDNCVFYVSFTLTSSILGSQATARLIALLFNYTAGRKAVFLAQGKHGVFFPRYLLLVIASGTVSYSLIQYLHTKWGIAVISAKLLAEGLLFIGNFCVQRDFVFKDAPVPTATDWNKYYESVPVTARLTRSYTGDVLLESMRRSLGRNAAGRTLVEIGGANSCFMDRIINELSPSKYCVIDNNEHGLELLRKRANGNGAIVLRNANVLHLPADIPEADVVFSIGLIEHFDAERTRQAILAHFDLLKPGGYAIMSFPTPTLLYRVARAISEFFRVWMFFDERPLSREEVVKTVAEQGHLIEEQLLWRLVFTQTLIVAQKIAASPRPLHVQRSPVGV